MTTVVAESGPITDGYLAALRDLGQPVGDARKPDGPANPPASFFPYLVLYTGITRIEGTLDTPNADALHRLQVTTVGKTRAGVDDWRHRARTVLLDVETAIDGHAVVWTELVTAQPINRDDDIAPGLFVAVDVVNAFITPDPSGS